MKDHVIDEHDSSLEAVVKMAEGNPGAINVMMQLLKDESINGALSIYWLDNLKIRGWRIWFAFKDCCQQDLHKLYNCLIHQDQTMIDKINEYAKMCGEHEIQN
jgi:hypothetical protein